MSGWNSNWSFRWATCDRVGGSSEMLIGYRCTVRL